MPYYEFSQNDIFRNQLETHPKCEFHFHNGVTYYNRTQPQLGEQDSKNENVTHVPSGHVSLHELNVDRKLSEHTYDAETDSGQQTMIYPFITKAGSLTSFKTVSTSDFQSFGYGTIMSGSYPMSATVTSDYYYEMAHAPPLADTKRRHVKSLKNTLNSYLHLSRHYDYSLYENSEIKIVNIPSIFYGSSIQKGTVELKVYHKGKLFAKLQDVNRNGELIQTYPETYKTCGPQPHPHYGRVAGVVLYNEGFVLLKGLWSMKTPYYDNSTSGYFRICPSCEEGSDYPIGTGAPFNPTPMWMKWVFFASLGDADDKTCNIAAGLDVADPSVTLNPDWSWGLSFSGTNYIPTLTMLAHAPKGELNHSNNPTFLEHGQDQAPKTSETEYIEKNNLEINNTVKAPYNNPEGNFRKQTWISKIGIYDDEKNLIGIVKLATPIRKTEERELTFKLKLDF